MIQTLTELFGRAERSVTHLEMRDTYGQTTGFRAWQEGVPVEQISAFEIFRPWIDLLRGFVDRGVQFRRARVVSEPVSDFIRYENAVTPATNLAAGEQVRWLPRQQAAELALPGADFWQIDGGLVCFIFQSGDGDPAGYRMSDDPNVARLCGSAFEAVWERGIDHGEYRPA
jgi:hypothetical protein